MCASRVLGGRCGRFLLGTGRRWDGQRVFRLDGDTLSLNVSRRGLVVGSRGFPERQSCILDPKRLNLQRFSRRRDIQPNASIRTAAYHYSCSTPLLQNPLTATQDTMGISTSTCNPAENPVVKDDLPAPPSHERELLYNLFTSFGTKTGEGGDGEVILKQDDIARMMSSMGIVLSDDKLHQVIERADLNGDGVCRLSIFTLRDLSMFIIF